MPAIGEKPVSSRAISPRGIAACAFSRRARFFETADARSGSGRLRCPIDAGCQPDEMASGAYEWFFETFVLKKFVTGYVPAIPEYAFLFNSYYNAAGTMHRRDLRGLISRPTVTESFRYREGIDRHIVDLIASASEELLDEIEPIITLGVHHEQQHQELLVTDIKHVFAQNPLHPVFRKRAEQKPNRRRPMTFCRFR